ncbi:RNA-binding protein, partial [Wenyingzhuangia sp. 1_MG-2023]|nr:RNA-binding protein [Wenyingzhuangia sp. 1_MG-2023]
STTQDELHELFSRFGEVERATVVIDRETNRSKGFGFVEMASSSDASSAIEALNNTDLNGRVLRVNEAKPRENRPRTPRAPRPS